MDKKLNVKESVSVNAAVNKVWDALTNPDLVKKYLFGTNLITDWQVGNDIIFKGSYEGKKYIDKGKIIKYEPEKLMQYTYLSNFSGLEDAEDNYSLVTYEIEENGSDVILSVSQEGFINLQAKEHSENSWGYVLEEIKKLVEEK